MPIMGGNKQLQAAGLNGLGNYDRGDKVVFSKSAKVLVDIATMIVDKAKRNLEKKGKNASFGLHDSIEAKDLVIEKPNKFSIEIQMNEYWKFVDKGVRGVQGGTGEFQFKTIYPSKKMKNAIKSWLNTRTRRALKYKAINKMERTDKSLKAKKTKAKSEGMTTESMAYAMATNIKKNGIKPTYFFTDAMKVTQRVFRKEIAAGFKLDIIENLK